VTVNTDFDAAVCLMIRTKNIASGTLSTLFYYLGMIFNPHILQIFHARMLDKCPDTCRHLDLPKRSYESPIRKEGPASTSSLAPTTTCYAMNNLDTPRDWPEKFDFMKNAPASGVSLADACPLQDSALLTGAYICQPCQTCAPLC